MATVAVAVVPPMTTREAVKLLVTVSGAAGS
jgi:hypothetical protein